MNIAVLRESMARSLRGEVTFPEVVKVMMAEGVESYWVDLVRREDTFYMPDGQSHRETMEMPASVIDSGFAQAEVIAAIRAAQADSIRYPEFVRRLAAAGATGYAVYLAGKKVVYFGRKGEMHVEEFPGAKV